MNLHFAGAVTSLAWSPNGQVLAAASLDAPGFVVFDISLGVGTPLQAGVHAFRGRPSRCHVSFHVWCGKCSCSLRVPSFGVFLFKSCCPTTKGHWCHFPPALEFAHLLTNLRTFGPNHQGMLVPDAGLGLVTVLSWSPDGAFLLTGGADESFRVWQTQRWTSVAWKTRVSWGTSDL